MNLIITNANVITLDDRSSRAEAVAILGGRIVRVGTNEEAMSMAVDPVTVLDMEGKTVVPGFVESHVHPVMAAHYNLEMVNCGTPPNRTIEDIVEKLGEAAKQAGRGEWISGSRVLTIRWSRTCATSLGRTWTPPRPTTRCTSPTSRGT